MSMRLDIVCCSLHTISEKLPHKNWRVRKVTFNLCNLNSGLIMSALSPKIGSSSCSRRPLVYYWVSNWLTAFSVLPLHSFEVNPLQAGTVWKENLQSAVSHLTTSQPDLSTLQNLSKRGFRNWKVEIASFLLWSRAAACVVPYLEDICVRTSGGSVLGCIGWVNSCWFFVAPFEDLLGNFTLL